MEEGTAETVPIRVRKQGDFEWIIESWRNVSKLVNGKFISSPWFQIEDKSPSWTLHVYPNGQDSEDYGCVSVVLYSSQSSFVEASVEISLVGRKYKKVYSKKLSNLIIGSNDSVQFQKFLNKNNSDNVIKKILNEDEIIILCEITMFEASTIIRKPRINSFKIESASNLNWTVEQDKFEKLLEDKTCSDVVFKVGDKEFHLHKIILLTKSPVFAAMFEHDMRENQQNVVNVVDINPSIFKEILRFIYTGKVNEIENVADELIVAADKYCMEDLKKECETVLSRNITLDNAIACLGLAVHHNTNLFKKNVLDFILKNKKVVVNKSEFKALTKRDPDLMFEVCKAMASYDVDKYKTDLWMKVPV